MLVMFDFIKSNFEYLNGDTKSYILEILTNISNYNAKLLRKDLISNIYRLVTVNHILNPSYDDKLLRKILYKSYYSVGIAAYQVYINLNNFYEQNCGNLKDLIVILDHLLDIMIDEFDWENWSNDLKDKNGNLIYKYKLGRRPLLTTSFKLMNILLMTKLSKTTNIIHKMKDFIIRVYDNVFRGVAKDTPIAILYGEKEYDSVDYAMGALLKSFNNKTKSVIIDLIGKDVVKIAKKAEYYNIKSIIKNYKFKLRFVGYKDHGK